MRKTLFLAVLCALGVSGAASAAPFTATQQAAIQANQQADQRAAAAAKAYLQSKEDQSVGTATGVLSGSTQQSSTSIPPAAQSDYSQYQSNQSAANYWAGQEWQSYSYSCGTTKKPQTCTGWSWDQQAANEAAAYQSQANADYQRYQENNQQDSQMQAKASALKGEAAQYQQQAQQQKQVQQNQIHWASQSASQSDADVAASGAATNAQALASGNAAAQQAFAGIAQTTGVPQGTSVPNIPVPPQVAASPTFSDTGGQALLSTQEAMQQDTADRANDYVAREQHQKAADRATVEAQQDWANAQAAPTKASRSAWTAAAQAAQAKASAEQAQANHDKAMESQAHAAARQQDALAQQEAATHAHAIDQQASQYGKQVSQSLSAGIRDKDKANAASPYQVPRSVREAALKEAEQQLGVNIQ